MGQRVINFLLLRPFFIHIALLKEFPLESGCLRVDSLLGKEHGLGFKFGLDKVEIVTGEWMLSLIKWR